MQMQQLAHAAAVAHMHAAMHSNVHRLRLLHQVKLKNPAVGFKQSAFVKQNYPAMNDTGWAACAI